MRKITARALPGLLALAALALSAADRPIDDRFRETVRPFLDARCVSCHGRDDPEGGLDLTAFPTAESAAKDLKRWRGVQERLQNGSMPPEDEPRPPAEARDAVVAWVAAMRRAEAAKDAGEPGIVPARRLSNAEYDNTVRDLTGFDLRPTREFPVDPANEAGFDNSAESLAMTPALAKKYLDAARYVADHLVLAPDGLAFAPHPVLADTDRDKYCVKRVIDFYNRQPTDLADYFLAAWRHRRARGPSLDAIADEAGISRKYLATVWGVLNEGAEDFGPVASLRAMWRALPDDEDARPGCERMRAFVVALRDRLVPEVPNLKARGINEGTQPFVLWKNRRIAANRMRYAGGGAKVRVDDLGLEADAARALAAPAEGDALAKYEESFARFCRVFPDAFYVTERSRIYLGDMDKRNTGRLLSAGFHSMTGYFRDDGPLGELVLDDEGRKELEDLWREFDYVTGAPMRQYSSYLWYERAETGYLRGEPAFDFVRAEDRDAASPEKMGRFAEAYLAKARRLRADDEALGAIEGQFRIIGEQIRAVERDRAEAEPKHVEALQAFAGRAFRRPLSADERRGVADFYRELRGRDGLSHEDAVRDAVVGVLLSPNFCYRVNQPAEGAGVRPLSDFDLASRLSYFLWASMPDDELLSAASAGELSRPETLVAQARRMLRDPKARGLAVEFGGNWLDFRRFEEHNGVDRGRFPAFDDALRRSMFEEPVRLLLDVITNDRPVATLLDARYTFVDRALARHYGMPEPASDGWACVDDADRYGRGGLPPMAVFLTRNSPGLRTSPVKRGYWVVKRLLGEEIPAPPADVPDLPDDESKLGEQTLREALARHRADKACAGCHERFDAIGLAFEGYGPVGEARKVDLAGHPIDARATFPRGGEGDGLEGLRSYLATSRRDEFVDNLCRKLLAYGLGRTAIPSDDATVDAMRARLDAEGGRFGALVEAIVASPSFRNQRIEAPAEETP